MSNMSSEDKMAVSDYIDSPSTEEVASEGNMAEGGLLKKGPWTSAEDAILVDYVNKHGEGNWNAVPKHSGLSRCGKGCRLRWANHLRPDLKKGSFTPAEERRIIELHAKMGNKWARMAAELPGRTDNEIKNFWNTRIKRRQRAGLPIYPPDICFHSLDENTPSPNVGLSRGETPNLELLPTNNMEIPSVEFKSLGVNQELHPSFVDIPLGGLLSTGLNSTCGNSFLLSKMHAAKRLRKSELSLPGFSAIHSALNQYENDFRINTKSCGASYDHDLSSSSCLLPGSHAISGGSLDEPQFMKTLLVMEEEVDWDSFTQSDEKDGDSYQKVMEEEVDWDSFTQSDEKDGDFYHLRPDLKKGSFTPAEERRIIELHAKMGNKWARKAAELPGRTDNEIKNFWNTRIKRRQRAGLPIYPPDICFHSLDENTPSSNMGLSIGETPNLELLPTNNMEIPSVEFKSLGVNQELHPSFVDIPLGGLLSTGLNSTCGDSFLLSKMHPTKRLRKSELSLPGVSAIHSALNQYENDFRISTKSFGASYDHDLSSSSCLLPGSHALINGNSSSFPVSWAMKLELPSLQYSDTQIESWASPSMLPSLESVDTLIQTPPDEHAELGHHFPKNNGLLESILYESQAMKNVNKNSHRQNSNTGVPANGACSSTQLHDGECNLCGDSNSPLGQSITSVFCECTPISGGSLDEPQFVKTLPVMEEEVDWDSFTQSDEKDGDSYHMNVSRPDFLLDSNWFGLSTDYSKDHFIIRDAIGALLAEDYTS